MKLRGTAKGRTVEIEITPEMIERVLTEWGDEHPGRDATVDMNPDEFARRMMLEIRASARLLP
jgi:hypothetical protein